MMILGRLVRLIPAAAVALAAANAAAQNWEQVPVIQHRAFQAVHADGSSAYAGGFPARLVGVVLNNPDDWLDPTPAFDPEYHPFQLGGQWEVFVQSFPLPGSDDFGGTAAWIGQNYGNMPWHADPEFSYTDVEWLAELARLNYPDGPGTEPLRAGDLVELRARAGLAYQGKMNVNEQHSIDPAVDFELVLIERGAGPLPPTQITLSDLLVPASGGGFEFIWDPTRLTGGEHYQAARVLIRGVQLADDADWGPNGQLLLVDATGRALPVQLGRNAEFGAVAAPSGTFNLIAIINQVAPNGQGGYMALAMRAADFVCGDANCDGELDFRDINPFVLALADPAAYGAAYAGCVPDLNGDFIVGFDDINRFVTALTSGTCP